MPSLLQHQLNLELRELHVKTFKSFALQSTVCENCTQSKEVSPTQPQNWGSVITFRQMLEQKAVFPVRANTNTQRGKQTDLGERWFKRGEKPESWRSFWPLIPPLRKLEEGRWASAPALHHCLRRGGGGHSQALSTPHKETGKVKEDYKKGDVSRGENSLAELSMFAIQVKDGLIPLIGGLRAPSPWTSCCLQYCLSVEGWSPALLPDGRTLKTVKRKDEG